MLPFDPPEPSTVPVDVLKGMAEDLLEIALRSGRTSKHPRANSWLHTYNSGYAEGMRAAVKHFQSAWS